MITATAAASAHSGALAGRVILINGAHGALGAVTSVACAEAGATVVLLGRKVAKLNQVYDSIVRHAPAVPTPINYPLDLAGATADDYAELAQRIEMQLGRLDGVLHCAADFAGLTPLEHTDPATFARALHVNLTAKWWLTQACLPALKQAQDSAIVFVVDALERVGNAYWGGYGVAQHGLAALVAMLHAELANSTVRVAALQPGPMRSALRASAYVDEHDPRALDAAEYAGNCVTLLSAAGQRHRGSIWNPARSNSV